MLRLQKEEWLLEGRMIREIGKSCNGNQIAIQLTACFQAEINLAGARRKAGPQRSGSLRFRCICFRDCGLPGLLHTGLSRSPFCRVAAVLDPSSNFAISIELWMLQANWNGRLEGTGNFVATESRLKIAHLQSVPVRVRTTVSLAEKATVLRRRCAECTSFDQSSSS